MKQGLKKLILPLNILLFLLVGFGVWLETDQLLQDNAINSFNADTYATTQSIINSLESQINALYSARGATTINAPSSVESWDTFVESQFLFERYPGLVSVNYAVLVQHANLDTFLADANSKYDYLQPITLRPINNSAVHLITVLAASKTSRVDASESIGFDSLISPVKKYTIDKAIQEGLPAMTEPISIRDTGRLGAEVYLPIYPTVADTDTDLQNVKPVALASVTFDTQQLIADSVGKETLPNVKLEVKDADSGSTLYANNVDTKSGLEKSYELEVGFRKWRLDAVTGRYYTLSFWQRITPICLALSVVSLMFTGLRAYKRSGATA